MPNYYMLVSKTYNICLIPEDDFKRMFQICGKNEVEFNPDIEWHPMSGGQNTYLSSYSFYHARSPFPLYGDYKDNKMVILGCYDIDF